MKHYKRYSENNFVLFILQSTKLAIEHVYALNMISIITSKSKHRHRAYSYLVLNLGNTCI